MGGEIECAEHALEREPPPQAVFIQTRERIGQRDIAVREQLQFLLQERDLPEQKPDQRDREGQQKESQPEDPRPDAFVQGHGILLSEFPSGKKPDLAGRAEESCFAAGSTGRCVEAVHEGPCPFSRQHARLHLVHDIAESDPVFGVREAEAPARAGVAERADRRPEQ